MTRIMLTGIAAVVALALASAVVMVANAPASPRTPAGDPFTVDIVQQAPENSVGRLVLTFEPATSQIDRN